MPVFWTHTFFANKPYLGVSKTNIYYTLCFYQPVVLPLLCLERALKNKTRLQTWCGQSGRNSATPLYKLEEKGKRGLSSEIRWNKQIQIKQKAECWKKIFPIFLINSCIGHRREYLYSSFRIHFTLFTSSKTFFLLCCLLDFEWRNDKPPQNSSVLF